MTHKQADKKLQYTVLIVVVLIGVLYVLSTLLGKGIKGEDNKMVALTPVVTDTSAAATDADHPYLGMKTWNWVKTKDASGTVTATPTGDKPFTISFDFNSNKYSVATDCNTGGGLFAAKSGVVQLGADTLTKNSCAGSQEGVFTGSLTSVQKFYFVTAKSEMVLETKDGTQVVFK